jgi:inner membrane protein
MDNLTHSLVGALLGQAGLKTKTGLAMPALIIGANLPDVDAACFFWLEGTEHLGFRRGITHGPPALVLLPLILMGFLWGFDRWQQKRGKRPEGRLPLHLGWLFALAFIGCLTHPALDWLNVYGIRLLEPFSSRWFYGDTLFIIDVWLWALMGLGVWFSMRREKREENWKRPAWIGIVVGLAYIGMNGVMSDQARSAKQTTFDGFADIIASPVPINFWEREIIYFAKGAEPEKMGPVLGYWSAISSAADDELRFLGSKYAVMEDGSQAAPWAKDLAKTNSQVRSFLFWSRVPFATCSKDGSVILYDARYYDPRARDRFSVALPDVECVELPAE